MASHQDLVQNATVQVDRIEDIDRSHLVEILKKYNFARITGLVKPEAAARSRELMRKRFRMEDDRATTGESHEEVKTNFQKISIGRARHGGVDRPRFMRCFYNPLWAEDIYEMRENFRKVAQLRNILGNRELDFATDKEEGGMWTAARIHQFPTGGGFMVAHRDTVLPKIYDDKGLGDFFQPVLLLTQKGEDFETGGGFAEVAGERVVYEDFAGRGDIVIYDTSTVHGVDDVDTHKPYRQDSIDGRMSALVTLYKSL
ncbi:MAG: hypothetical protein KC416_13565 [Myxococcales bacterium]|nr:hypothetical protein [Myxococcales bacterium]